MIPHTLVIYDIHRLLETVSLYGRHGIEKVILKHDRKNAGLGIFLFRDIEDVYTQAANKVIPYPFVIQPYIHKSRDLRVIVLGDYLEAYERKNPHSFRNNLHCGGAAAPVRLSTEQLKLCHAVMERGDYPYGHLDLMVTEKDETYLAEINLRGGIRGAAINPGDYTKRVKDIEADLLQKILDQPAVNCP
jgi:ribosomal protein S6--L-glutamate ligase